MISHRNNLLFPTIKYLRDDSLIHSDHRTKDVTLFTLDWSYKDKVVKQNHIDWATKYWPNKKIKFIEPLPEKWDLWTKSLVFSIPNCYMSEIRRNSERALSEWNVSRSFDTNVREMCLTPAIEHAYIAFYLLSDCLYDETTKYFDRKDSSRLAVHAMSYKFWSGQTGRGCRWSHAHIDELENRETRLLLSRDMYRTPTVITEFISDLKKYEEEYNKSFNTAET